LILFLHGFPHFWYAWKSLLTEFGKDHRAVALDLPGYNLSEKPKALSAYEVEHIVADVWAFAREVSPNKTFALVAHDWGGYIAWALAVAYPGVLHKLVIINAPHPAIFAQLLHSDSMQQKASNYMELFRSAQAEQILSANDFEFLGSSVMGFGRENGLPRLSAKIDVPTLVIWGMNDPALLPQNLHGLEQYVTRLTIHRIFDASHWLVHTHADHVNQLIRSNLVSSAFDGSE